MKSFAELEAIRQRTLDQVNLRREHEGTRIVRGHGHLRASPRARARLCWLSWTKSASAACWM